MKALFCTDGSQISYGAIVNFSQWFKNYTADILTVADWTCLSDVVLSEVSSISSKCSNNANSILDYSQHFFYENNINFGRKIKSCGSAVDVILSNEKDEEYEYLIMGSNGKKGLQKWLGSVSQEVASFSKSSVYISKSSNYSNKVVFALDDSLISSRRFINTLKNMNLEGKDIHILTVYQTPEYLFLEGNMDSNWVVDIDEKQKREGLMLLSQYEEIFNDFGYDNLHKSVLSGNNAEAIIKYCDENKADLVVCGMRTRNAISKILPGSVSRRILENVAADVLIMK